MENLKEKVKSVRTIYCNYQEKNGFTFAMSDETARKWQLAGLKVFKADVSFEELPLEIPDYVLPYVDVIAALTAERLRADFSRPKRKSESSSRKKLSKNSPEYEAWTTEMWEMLKMFEETDEKFTLLDVSELVSVPTGDGFMQSFAKTKDFTSRFLSLKERERINNSNFTYYVSRKRSSENR